ncbi:hypothetical protein VNI00_006474 [Paramarasmius palmivorus]|uniref:Mitochondrial import inner membrane translocase subunit TIM50 n=1 Tax=Paramarasmius palmivorus TaxID=297713 RepID=A0AAW0DBA1_9AGAR
MYEDDGGTWATDYSDAYNTPPPVSSTPPQPQTQTNSKKQTRKRKRTDSTLPSNQPNPSTPPPLKPSEEYFIISNTPSQTLAIPSNQRKLLILDLNGTLCFREPHANPNTYNQRERPLRKVHARPYADVLKEYLWHEETKAWLDVMVWSSAMPGSVRGMVGSVWGEEVFPPESGDSKGEGNGEPEKDEFGRDIPRTEVQGPDGDNLKGRLVAMWARDTLGLPEDAYWAKTQTTKDLEKPWSLLPDLNQHNAQTTLLIDDSPLKALLQPYNHICVPEYGEKMWQWDRSQRPDEGQGVEADGAGAADVQDGVVNGVKADVGGAPILDHTLLALIGLLDTIKNQDNVASWVKSGGLFSSTTTSTSTASPSTTTTTPPDLESIYTASVPELSLPSPTPKKKERWRKRNRHRQQDNEKEEDKKEVLETKGPLTYTPSIGDFTHLASWDLKPDEVDGIPGLTRSNTPVAPSNSNTHGEPNATTNTEGDVEMDDSTSAPVIDTTVGTATATDASSNPTPTATTTDTDTTTPSTPTLVKDASELEQELEATRPQWSWYQDSSTRTYWVQRGIGACQALGLEVK